MVCYNLLLLDSRGLRYDEDGRGMCVKSLKAILFLNRGFKLLILISFYSKNIVVILDTQATQYYSLIILDSRFSVEEKLSNWWHSNSSRSGGPGANDVQYWHHYWYSILHRPLCRCCCTKYIRMKNYSYSCKSINIYHICQVILTDLT